MKKIVCNLNEYFLCLQAAEDYNLPFREENSQKQLLYGYVISTPNTDIWCTARLADVKFRTYTLNLSLFHGKTLEYATRFKNRFQNAMIEFMNDVEALNGEVHAKQDGKLHRIV